MSWSFVLGPPAPGGGHQWQLTDAKARKATFRLTAPSEASFVLDGRDKLAEKITELATDLHVLRRGPDGLNKILFRGRAGTSGDDLDGERHTVSVTALDYRAVLNRRILWSDSKLVWTAIEQAQIAYELIQQTQVRPGGNLGISQGVGSSTGIARDREYAVGDSIGQRVQELSEVIDGFDWDITPASASALMLDIWPERGVDRGVILEYGGLVRSLTRRVDPGEYANAVRLTGTLPEGGGAEPTPVERAAADLATRPEGRWDKTFGTTIVLQNTLNQRADWQLDQSQVVRPAYTVRLKKGSWGGPDHIWLGDPVRLVVMSGRLQVDSVLRVHEIDVAISDDGDEDVSLTIGAPKPDLRKRATAVERRLADLERR